MASQLFLITFIVLTSLTFNPTSAQSGNSISGVKGIKGSIAPMGGCITIYREMSVSVGGNSSNKTTMKTPDIAITFLRLAELNNEKQTIVDKNNITHEFKGFDKQSFNCEMKQNVTMPASSYLKGDCWYCSTTLADIYSGITFKTTICVVQGNGTITLGSETSNVKEGQVKLSVEMAKGWPWCEANAGCKNGEGKFLDLDIGIKLPDAVKKSNTSDVKTDGQPTRFELGSGVTVDFSTMALLDSSWGKLVDNMPSIVRSSNNSNTVTMRFNRFANSLLYDPTFEAGNVAFAQSSCSKFSVISIPALLLVAVVTAWMTSH